VVAGKCPSVADCTVSISQDRPVVSAFNLLPRCTSIIKFLFLGIVELQTNPTEPEAKGL